MCRLLTQTLLSWPQEFICWHSLTPKYNPSTLRRKSISNCIHFDFRNSCWRFLWNLKIFRERRVSTLNWQHSLFPLSSKAKKAPTENPETRLIPYFTAGLFILFSEVVIPTKKRGALNESAVICCSWDPASRFHPCPTVSTCTGFLNKA